MREVTLSFLRFWKCTQDSDVKGNDRALFLYKKNNLTAYPYNYKILCLSLQISQCKYIIRYQLRVGLLFPEEQRALHNLVFWWSNYHRIIVFFCEITKTSN